MTGSSSQQASSLRASLSDAMVVDSLDTNMVLMTEQGESPPHEPIVRTSFHISKNRAERLKHSQLSVLLFAAAAIERQELSQQEHEEEERSVAIAQQSIQQQQPTLTLPLQQQVHHTPSIVDQLQQQHNLALQQQILLSHNKQQQQLPPIIEEMNIDIVTQQPPLQQQSPLIPSIKNLLSPPTVNSMPQSNLPNNAGGHTPASSLVSLSGNPFVNTPQSFQQHSDQL